MPRSKRAGENPPSLPRQSERVKKRSKSDNPLVNAFKKSLFEELSFALPFAKSSKTRLTAVVLNEPPLRSALSFQIIKDADAPRVLLAGSVGLVDDAQSTNLTADEPDLPLDLRQLDPAILCGEQDLVAIDSDEMDLDELEAEDEVGEPEAHDAAAEGAPQPTEMYTLFKKLKVIFCFVHREFVGIKDSEIDHAYPYHAIRDNQINLLNYLTENLKFTRELLADPRMTDFFRLGQDGKVRGTAYFYKLCYNNADNLWLLCHSCNNDKSDRPLEAWLDRVDPLLGKSFRADIELKGGTHCGILFDHLFEKAAAEDILSITMGARKVELFSGKVFGLGHFLQNKFFEQHLPIYEAQKRYYLEHYSLIKADVDRIFTLQLQQKTDEANSLFTKLNKKLTTMQASGEGFEAARGAEGHSSSDEDTPTMGSLRKGFAKDTSELNDHTLHNLKKIHSAIMQKFDQETAEKVFSGLKFEGIILENDTLVRRFDAFCESLGSLGSQASDGVFALVEKHLSNCSYAPPEGRRHLEEQLQATETARLELTKQLEQLKLGASKEAENDALKGQQARTVDERAPAGLSADQQAEEVREKASRPDASAAKGSQL
jgi:hypothetical protein